MGETKAAGGERKETTAAAACSKKIKLQISLSFASLSCVIKRIQSTKCVHDMPVSVPEVTRAVERVRTVHQREKDKKESRRERERALSDQRRWLLRLVGALSSLSLARSLRSEFSLNAAIARANV